MYVQFDHLSDSKKGELIGHTIGKYGVDVFAGGFVIGGAIKGGKVVVNGASAYRKLKNVNRVYNLEAMAASNANKGKIIADSLKHAASRESYFKTVKYNFDAHNKHVIGHNDYKEFRSIWEHPDPEGLLRKFAGKGIPHRGEPGLPNYKEAVNFEEHVGVWKDKAGKQALSTTRGTIHYSNKGAHIVPSDPNPHNK